MKNIAIISEYNLFHNGHSAQIDYLRNKFTEIRVIALMSGNFVQRGELAYMPKHERAQAAVECGADLVLELPYPYSGGCAEYFARGAVSILNKLNAVDYLCFGSERGDITSITQTARRQLTPEYRKALDEAWAAHRSDSMSYIKIKQEVYETLYGDSFTITPNDILGAEYVKSLILSQSKIIPITVKRSGEASASKTRSYLERSQYNMFKSIVPDKAFDIFLQSMQNGVGPADFRRLERGILAYFRLADPDKLKQYADVTDGFEMRLINSACEAASLDEFYHKCATKKYTDAKIRRIILNCMLGTTEADLKSEPLFTRVLACNTSGRTLLRHMTNIADITILTKPAHYKRHNDDVISQFERSMRADRLYSLALPEILSADYELLKNPYITNNTER